MKVVFLLAGTGRRMGEITATRHKSLIPLLGKPLFQHLITRFIDCGVENFVLVLGHDEKGIKKLLEKEFNEKTKFEIATNLQYDSTNNMYSIYCAQEFLKGEEFILCNGDMVINKNIINKILHKKNLSRVVIDDKRRFEIIDSPKTTVNGDRFSDLGRHIDISNNYGYAIGLYQFSKEVSTAYFDQIKLMLKKGNINAGFHDPLIDLFDNYHISPLSTDGLSWADIDEPADISIVEDILKTIIEEERLNGI